MADFSINDAVQELLEEHHQPWAAALLAARAAARVLPLLAGIQPARAIPPDAAPAIRAVFSRSAIGLSAVSPAGLDPALVSALVGSKTFYSTPAIGTSLAEQSVHRAIQCSMWVLALSLSGGSLDSISHNAVMAIESAAEATVGRGALVRSVREDLPFIKRRTRGENVSMELWRSGAPEMVSAAWKGLCPAMARLDDDMGIWADWYDRVLDGRDWSFDVQVDASGAWRLIPKGRP